MFALLQQQTPGGPELVHELFAADPKLPAGVTVVDVSKWPGVAVGWAHLPDGSFGPFVPALADAQADRVRTLRFDCLHAIIGGFTSSALGSVHSYGSSDTDRENIDRAAMASLTGQSDPNWTAQIPCTVGGAPATFTPHNAAQVHQVSADLHAFIQAARLKLDGLKTQVGAAATVQAVQAIVWS